MCKLSLQVAIGRCAERPVTSVASKTCRSPFLHSRSPGWEYCSCRALGRQGGSGWQEPAGTMRLSGFFPAALCPEAQYREGQLLLCGWVVLFIFFLMPRSRSKDNEVGSGQRGETAGRNQTWERMFWLSGNGRLQRKPEPVCRRRTMWWEPVDWIWAIAKLWKPFFLLSATAHPAPGSGSQCYFLRLALAVRRIWLLLD